jgi:uncharacterized protein (DUF736 family)
MKLNFSLFKNTYKEAGSNQPDYTCSVYDKETNKSTKIGGGWIKEGKNGKYISISLDDEYKPKEDPAQTMGVDTLDETGIPF